MLRPAIGLMLARARADELRGEAERSSVTGGHEGMHRLRGRKAVADSSPGRRLLVSQIRALIRLADSLDYQRDELVRMIRSLS